MSESKQVNGGLVRVGGNPPALNLAERVFGRLTVIEFAGRNKHGEAMWWCRCSCGKRDISVQSRLTKGLKESCGCLHREMMANKQRTHNMRHTPEYNTWSQMRKRCELTTDHAYPRYGGRGITVCPEWADFATFYRDMGPKPSPQHSIDRIDNNKGYCKENCRWATRTEQGRNRRGNHMFNVDGEVMCRTELCEKFGASYSTVRKMMGKGRSHDEIIAYCKDVDAKRKALLLAPLLTL